MIAAETVWIVFATFNFHLRKELFNCWEVRMNLTCSTEPAEVWDMSWDPRFPVRERTQSEDLEEGVFLPATLWTLQLHQRLIQGQWVVPELSLTSAASIRDSTQPCSQVFFSSFFLPDIITLYPCFVFYSCLHHVPVNQEPRHLQCVSDLENLNVYTVVNSRKLHGAPADFTFCIKVSTSSVRDEASRNNIRACRVLYFGCLFNFLWAILPQSFISLWGHLLVHVQCSWQSGAVEFSELLLCSSPQRRWCVFSLTSSRNYNITLMEIKIMDLSWIQTCVTISWFKKTMVKMVTKQQHLFHNNSLQPAASC